MKDQRLKDGLLIILLILFSSLSFILIAKNVFLFLSSYKENVPYEGNQVEDDISFSESTFDGSFLEIDSRPVETTQPTFQEDLDEFPVPAAYSTSISQKSKKEIPLDDTLKKPNSIKKNLYFVRFSSDGLMLLSIRPYTIRYDNMPILETLKTLIRGPSIDDLSQNYISLIPKDSEILSISVRDSIATIDMNNAFCFNPLGNEGILNQLKQIVYTATEFPLIKKVKFLIEGKKTDFLNAEGVFIGKPLGRNDFK